MIEVFYVPVGEVTPSPARACSGVPQSSVFGSLLLLAYINDLTQGIRCLIFLFTDNLKSVGNPVHYHPTGMDKWRFPQNAGTRGDGDQVQLSMELTSEGGVGNRFGGSYTRDV